MTYLVKRPVAFRIPRADPATAGATLVNGAWRYFTDEAEANVEAEALGVEYQGLYVRDGTAIVGEWEPIETAPMNKNNHFLVCSTKTGQSPFVVRGDILWSGLQSNTPASLSMSHLTHWMPLPAMPPVILKSRDEYNASR